MPTLTELIKQANFTYVYSDITEANFPLESDGLEEVTIFHFGKTLTTEQAIAEIKKQGFEPARIEHLLQYAITNPDYEDFIAALGSSCVSSNGRRCSPYLRVDGHERNLRLDWVDYDWDGSCRFLAFKPVHSDTQSLGHLDKSLRDVQVVYHQIW